MMRSTEITPSATEVELAVGEIFRLKGYLSPTISTDTIKFISGDKKIATVGMSSGRIDAKSAGETTITVYALATKSTKFSSTTSRKATVHVLVKEGDRLLSVEQTGDYEYKATFGEDTSKIKLDMLTVIRASDETEVPIKSIKKKHGRSAVFVLGEPLEDDTFIFRYNDSAIEVRSRKLRAETVTPDPLEIKANVGTETTLRASLSPEKATDVLRYVSRNPEIASVGLKTGVVKCLTTGETEITVYALKKDGAKLTPEGNATALVPVTVTSQEVLAVAEQIAPEKVRLRFLMDATALTAADLRFTKADGGDAGLSVKSLDQVKGDPLARTAVLSGSLLSGGRYAFHYKDSSAEFDAMEMRVNQVKVLPAFVAPGYAAKLYAKAYDKDGKVLYSTDDYLVISLDSLSEGGIFEGNHLMLRKAGDEAAFTVTADFAKGKTILAKDFTEAAVVGCKELGTYCFCEALYPSHKMGDGKVHDPAACKTLGHFYCDGADHTRGLCGLDGHFNCDGRDHKAAVCEIAGHFACDGKNHDPAPCDVNGHNNCDGKDHGKCPYCGLRLCNGQTHGNGICNYVPPVDPSVSPSPSVVG